MQELHKNRSRRRALFRVAAALLAGLTTNTVLATQWNAQVGAQSSSLDSQVLAFLPNEFWIYAGDSIQFTFATYEPHTVSLLKSGQTRPAAFSLVGIGGRVFVGCPGTTPDGSSFDDSACVTSAPSPPGQTYTVNFPSEGNFKLVCLVHTRMTGAIHVLPLSGTLPYTQADYDLQAQREGNRLLRDALGLQNRGNGDAQQASGLSVMAGASAILANGGGSQTIAVMRFLSQFTVVHVGDTVEWTNFSTPVFHTITFGTEPANDMLPSSGVTVDSDGIRHAVVSSPNDNVNSGFIGSPNQETVGQPQGPLDFTRFRVTFPAPGTFNYICALHDELGMKGMIIVQQ